MQIEIYFQCSSFLLTPPNRAINGNENSLNDKDVLNRKLKT